MKNPFKRDRRPQAERDLADFRATVLEPKYGLPSETLASVIAFPSARQRRLRAWGQRIARAVVRYGDAAQTFPLGR